MSNKSGGIVIGYGAATVLLGIAESTLNSSLVGGLEALPRDSERRLMADPRRIIMEDLRAGGFGSLASGMTPHSMVAGGSPERFVIRDHSCRLTIAKGGE